MKKFLIFLLMLLLPLSAIADGDFFDPGTYAVVNNPNPEDRLNLRAHPSTDAESLGKYYNGTLVRLVAEYETSPEWVYVEIGYAYGSANGFMMRKYLGDAETVQTPSCTPARTAHGLMQIYARPDASSKVMARLDADTPYTVLGYQGEWEHIMANGCIGYAQRRQEGTIATAECTVGSRHTTAELELLSSQYYVVRVKMSPNVYEEPNVKTWRVYADQTLMGNMTWYLVDSAPGEEWFVLDLGFGDEPQNLRLVPLLADGTLNENDAVWLNVK